MDQIILRDLVARGIIGVYDWERQEPQDILVNVVMYADLCKAGESDNIADCVDYHAVAQKIQIQAERSGRFTVEALAEDLARLCLETPGVHKVRVRVEKPGAVRFARSAGVEIERSRKV